MFTAADFELTLYQGKSTVRVIFWVNAQLPLNRPHSLEARYGLTCEKIWISSNADERG
jgi:hypothetical protein